MIPPHWEPTSKACEPRFTLRPRSRSPARAESRAPGHWDRKLTDSGPCPARTGRLTSLLKGDTLAVLGFCILATGFAQVRVPLPGTPVPMTLQVLAVLLCGMTLRPVSAGAAMALYVGAGTFMPFMFAHGSAGLAGITGGYLLGFVPAAGLVAVIGGRRAAVLRLTVAGAIGTVAIFAAGVAWQMLLLQWTLAQAFAEGVAPFLLKSLVQLGLAVSFMSLARPWEGRSVKEASS